MSNKIIISTLKTNSFCKCQSCGLTIAEIISDNFVPSAEDCYKKGNVPVPNFGWFCSQVCAIEYEKKYDIKFSRNEDGKIDYYNNQFTN